MEKVSNISEEVSTNIGSIIEKASHIGDGESDDEATVLDVSDSESEEDNEHKVGGDNEIQTTTGNVTLDKGIALFNEKWKNGLKFLISSGILNGDVKQSVAQFLMEHNERLSKEQLGEILAGEHEDDTELLNHFTSLCNFKGDTFEHALRKYLNLFMLPGEAQKISRVLEVFAKEYCNQNEGVFPNTDVAFVLAFGIIMLNTDAHNSAIPAKDKMTKDQFVRNHRGTWVDGTDPPTDLLEEIYDKIANNEIKMQTKGEPDKKGFLKGIHAGSTREGRSWFLLVGNEFRWYKDPTMRKMKGKLILDYLQVEENMDKSRFYLTSILSFKDVEFVVMETTKETLVTCKRFKVLCDDQKQMKAWANTVREHVKFDDLKSK